MVGLRRFAIALAACVIGVVGAQAQTASTGGTASSGTSGGATTGGGNTVSTSGGGGSASKVGSGSTTGTGQTFAGTVQSGFSGGGTTTATNSATGGQVGGVGGATTGGPTAYNPWRATYGNPYALGQSLMGNSSSKTGAAATKGFGQPLFTTSTTAIGAIQGLQNSSNSGNGFNNSNLSRTPRYTSVLSEDLPLAAHPPEVLQSQLQALVARSSAIKNNSQVRVFVDGSTVRLVGQVGSERERRVAESMLRLTPGVSAYEIDNRLAIPGQP